MLCKIVHKYLFNMVIPSRICVLNSYQLEVMSLTNAVLLCISSSDRVILQMFLSVQFNGKYRKLRILLEDYKIKSSVVEKTVMADIIIKHM